VSCAKDNSSRNSGAPLWVWITASVFALIFLVFSYLGFSGTDYYLEYFNAKRLERFAMPGDEKSLKIAVIGTSLVDYAFPKDESMERFAQDRGKKIRFLKFSRGAGVLDEYYDIADAVINSSADIIFFEAALFGLDQKFEDKGKLAYHRDSLRAGLKKQFLDLHVVPERLRRRPTINYTDTPFGSSPEMQSDKAAAQYKKNVSDFRIRDFREGKNFAPFFALARQRGKVIVFLDLSRSEKAWNMLPPTFEREFVETMSRYSEVYKIPYLRFPYRLSLDYFQDFAHYGPKGRNFYSEWFLSSLTSISGDAGK
jgi:hypothetical protein